jgi:nucleoside-diphosphate-sugar epimerase
VKVLVAGSTGALGIRTVRKLVEQGHEVFGLTRSQAKAGAISRLGATPVFGDVLDEASIESVVAEVRPEGVAQLLNAIPKRGAFRPSDLDATNELRTTGTRNLIASSVRHGVKRYVVESMIFGYGYGDRGSEPLSEDAPFADRVEAGQMNPALDALRVMERSALDTSDHPGLEGVALRLGLFYGPGVGSTEFMTSMLRKHLMFLPGGGKGQLSWIHVEDGAAAVVIALEEAAAGSVYNVVDDEPASMGDMAKEMAQQLGLPGPKNMPVGVAKLVSSYLAQMANTNLRASNARIKAELGWKPEYPTIREGVASIASAYQTK